MPYEKIVLQGKGYISTEALSLLSENNRNVILVNISGKPITYLNPVMESLTATQYRMAQYDTFRNPEKCRTMKETDEVEVRMIQFLIDYLKSEHKSTCKHSEKMQDTDPNGLVYCMRCGEDV